MHATTDQIIALTKLQHVDLETARLRRELDGLPQKHEIARLREKRAQIAEKRILAARLKAEAETQTALLEDEDAAAARKLQECSAAAASADFRSVDAAGKDLAGAIARRDEIAGRIDGLLAKAEEAGRLISAMDDAVSALDRRESELVRAYRESGGGLIARIAEGERERASLEAAVGPAIMRDYERISAAKGGVAMAYLDGSSCNTCRSAFDEGRVLKLRSEAPLTLCPSCGRLMVVDKRYNG